MMKNANGMIWRIGGGLASGVALIFAVIVPNEKAVMATNGTQFFILRWFHSLVWVFLAVACLMRSSKNKSLIQLSNPIAMLGGLCYAVYLFSFLQLPQDG